MQDNNLGDGEDGLISLLLKRQSELNSLLEVTIAINKNTSTPVLIQMLEVILQKNLQVGKLRLLIEKNNEFICVSRFGGELEHAGTLYRSCTRLKAKAPASLENNADPVLNNYNYFIPI